MVKLQLLRSRSMKVNLNHKSKVVHNLNGSLRELKLIFEEIKNETSSIDFDDKLKMIQDFEKHMGIVFENWNSFKTIIINKKEIE